MKYLFIIILCLIPILGNTTETIKISELGTASDGDATDDDYFVFVNDPGGSPVTKKILGSSLFGFLPRLGVSGWGTGICYSTAGVLSAESTITSTIGGFSNSLFICSDPSGNAITCSTQNMVTTGYVDGGVKVTVSTDASIAVSGTSGYYVNGDNDAITFTLPTAVAGSAYCFANLLYAQAITVDPAAGDQIVLDGVAAAAAEHIYSGGAVTDQLCVLAIDTTYWRVTSKTGTWVEETPP